jgi:hypothetical protein
MTDALARVTIDATAEADDAMEDAANDGNSGDEGMGADAEVALPSTLQAC